MKACVCRINIIRVKLGWYEAEQGKLSKNWYLLELALRDYQPVSNCCSRTREWIVNDHLVLIVRNPNISKLLPLNPISWAVVAGIRNSSLGISLQEHMKQMQVLAVQRNSPRRSAHQCSFHYYRQRSRHQQINHNFAHSLILSPKLKYGGAQASGFLLAC